MAKYIFHSKVCILSAVDAYRDPHKGALSDDKTVSSAIHDDDNYQRLAAAMSLSLMEALGMDIKALRTAVTTDWKAYSTK